MFGRWGLKEFPICVVLNIFEVKKLVLLVWAVEFLYFGEHTFWIRNDHQSICNFLREFHSKWFYLKHSLRYFLGLAAFYIFISWSDCNSLDLWLGNCLGMDWLLFNQRHFGALRQALTLYWSISKYLGPNRTLATCSIFKISLHHFIKTFALASSFLLLFLLISVKCLLFTEFSFVFIRYLSNNLKILSVLMLFLQAFLFFRFNLNNLQTIFINSVLSSSSVVPFGFFLIAVILGYFFPVRMWS